MSNYLRQLENMVMERKRKQYPSMPGHAIPKEKFTDRNTNGLTKAVLKTFEVHGLFATRIDSKGTYNQALKRFIPSTQKKGLPDVMAQAPSLPPIWIEVKCAATNDRLKPHQEEMLRELKRTGAIVTVAKDYDSFYEWFECTIKNKIKNNVS